MSGSLLDRLDPAAVVRFRNDLGALAGSDERLGLAVSGGPDSVAMLLLAAAARPGLIEAATVDHGLRPESRGEAEFVGELCAMLGVPHRTLVVEWAEPPSTAVQEQARERRYALLARWAEKRGLRGIVTAHHRDDQAETLLMRLQRGAGVTGLAAMRPAGRVPGSGRPLLRPLLGWSRADLAAICESAGVVPVQDPSNEDDHYERVRVRKALAETPWLDPDAIARSAGHLGAAEDAIAWAAEREWRKASVTPDSIAYVPADAPPEIRRRIAARAIATLASEGEGNPLRGQEIETILSALDNGGTATLRGVLCAGGGEWRFTRAPARRS